MFKRNVRTNSIFPREIRGGFKTPVVNAISGTQETFVQSNVQEIIFVSTVSTSNITLSGLQTINGYNTLENDAVLVPSQTTTSENGIYTASTGAWTKQDIDFEKIYRYVIISGSQANTEYYLSNRPLLSADPVFLPVSSDAVLKTTIDVTGTQINSCFTSPVELIGTQTGKTIIVHSAYLEGTFAASFVNTLDVATFNGSVFLAILEPIPPTVTSGFTSIYIPSNTSTSSTNIIQSFYSFENSIYLYSASNPTGADDLTITLFYSLI